MDNPNAIAEANSLVYALNERKKYWESVKNVNEVRTKETEKLADKNTETNEQPKKESNTPREQFRMDRILPNIGNRYFLSSEEANNGEKFYQNAEGSTNLAFIPNEIFEKIGIKPIPFKLTETMGWHVYDHHAKEAKLKDISDAIDFVLSVINNVDHVRLGRDNSYIFSVENGRERTGKRAISILLGSSNGDYYGIVSSGYEGVERLNRRPLLWAGSAVIAPATDAATVSVTSRDAQKSSEQSGGASDLSNVPSASEDTTSEEEMQESAQENADKAQEIDAASTAQQAEEQDKEERKQMLENMSIEELEKEIERIRNFNHPIFTMTEEEKAKEIAELQSIIDRKTQTSAQQATAEEATPQAEEQQTANEAQQRENVNRQIEAEQTAASEEKANNGEESNKPIGKGVFGNIYDQFKGKIKEALDFIMEHKDGDLLGVFHRSDVGDIDLVWGDDKGGFAHIINKHVGEGKSFANADDAIRDIDNIIKNGDIDFENGDKIVFIKDGKKVTIRKNIREKGKKIADKNWVLTAYDLSASDGSSAITTTNQGEAAPATDKSASKDTAKTSDSQEDEKKRTEKDKGNTSNFDFDEIEALKDAPPSVRTAIRQ